MDQTSDNNEKITSENLVDYLYNRKINNSLDSNIAIAFYSHNKDFNFLFIQKIIKKKIKTLILKIKNYQKNQLKF